MHISNKAMIVFSVQSPVEPGHRRGADTGTGVDGPETCLSAEAGSRERGSAKDNFVHTTAGPVKDFLPGHPHASGALDTGGLDARGWGAAHPPLSIVEVAF